MDFGCSLQIFALLCAVALSGTWWFSPWLRGRLREAKWMRGAAVLGLWKKWCCAVEKKKWVCWWVAAVGEALGMGMNC